MKNKKGAVKPAAKKTAKKAAAKKKVAARPAKKSAGATAAKKAAAKPAAKSAAKKTAAPVAKSAAVSSPSKGAMADGGYASDVGWTFKNLSRKSEAEYPPEFAVYLDGKVVVAYRRSRPVKFQYNPQPVVKLPLSWQEVGTLREWAEGSILGDDAMFNRGDFYLTEWDLAAKVRDMLAAEASS